MSTSAVSPVGSPARGTSDGREIALEASHYWWLWLITGTLWIVAALVVLQFDSASITTIGVIIGCMFVFSGVQQFVVAASGESMRWLSYIFGVLFIVAGIVAFINPEATFAGFADVLGFMFLLVGVWWTVQAFLSKGANPLWWLGLISGILMFILAFWTSGQFFIEKAYTLLVFAGIWGLMHGIGDIIRAFVVRSLRDAG